MLSQPRGVETFSVNSEEDCVVRHKSEGLDLITLEISSRFMFPKDGILTETSLAESLGKAPKIVRLIMQS